jgi:hypothetical protein
MGTGVWSPTEALGFAWNLIMKNFAGVALPITVGVVVVVLPVYVVAFAMGLVTGVAAQYIDPRFMGVFQILIQIVVGFMFLLVGSFIAGGVVEFALKTVRGQSPAFGEVFGGAKYYGSMFVGVLGFYVAIAIGMLLCVVPGYIVEFGLWPFAFVIVDQRLSGIDALKKAWEMTNGKKLTIFVFALLCLLVYLAGVLACGIGALLVSMPMIVLASAHMYLSFKGEPPRLQV